MATVKDKKKTAGKKATSTPPAAKKEQRKATAPAPSGGESWYTRGTSGLQKKHQYDEVARLRKERNIPRLYLKPTAGQHEEGFGPDNSARLVFLDSEGFWIHEHNLKLGGKWGNFFTCTKDFAPCEICNQLGEKPIYTCYYTVVDTRKFKKRDGAISQFRRVLFPAKGAAIDVLEDIKKDFNGDIRGLVIVVKRTSDRDPNCGRDFKVVMKDGKPLRINPAKRFEGDLSVKYDYPTVLGLPTPEDLAVAGVTPEAVVVGSDADIDDDEDVAEEAAGARTEDEDTDDGDDDEEDMDELLQ